MTKRTNTAGTTTYTWTNRDELHQMTDPLTTATSTHTWNADGTLWKIDRGGTTRAYGYDTIGRLTSDLLKASNGAGANLASQSYAYDADGNISQQVLALGTNTANGTHTYGYDTAGRLTSWTSNSGAVTNYTYDASGNRTGAGR